MAELQGGLDGGVLGVGIALGVAIGVGWGSQPTSSRSVSGSESPSVLLSESASTSFGVENEPSDATRVPRHSTRS